LNSESQESHLKTFWWRDSWNWSCFLVLSNLSQNWHLNFSLLQWTFNRCCLRFDRAKNILLHPGNRHLNSSLLWLVSMCCLNSRWILNASSQSRHLYFFAVTCISWCDFNCRLYLKTFSQILHFKLWSLSEWTCFTWTFNLAVVGKNFSHSEHSKSLKRKCVTTWLRIQCLLMYLFPQLSHIKG
jgi:hypothetical protein